MTDRKKNTRAFTKTNPDVPLYGELPPITRKNNNKKKGEAIHTWRPRKNTHDNSSTHYTDRRTSSCEFKV